VQYSTIEGNISVKSIFFQVSAIAGAAFALAFSADPSRAQDAPQHIRGKIASVSASQIVVTTRKGLAMTVKMVPNFRVAAMKRVDMAAIVPGSFVGTTTMELPDGTGRSLEVHVFPPGVKMGAGHYPWDLKPGSMMTNGDVGKVVAGAKGNTIEVAYPGGTHTILVPPKAPVVETVPGQLAMLKPGVAVFLIAAKQADGSLAADAVLVGERGAPPPM
jgi:hypothetical protein